MTDPTPTSAALIAQAVEMRKAADSPHAAIHSVYLRQGADLLDQAASALAVSERAQTSIREKLAWLRERLTCKHDYSHYCPNCGNSINVDSELDELEAALRTADALPQLTKDKAFTRTGETLPDPSGRATAPTDEAVSLRGLVAKWRKWVAAHPTTTSSMFEAGSDRATLLCADELEATLRRGDEPSSLPLSVPPSKPESSSASKIHEGTAEATPAPPTEDRCQCGHLLAEHGITECNVCACMRFILPVPSVSGPFKVSDRDGETIPTEGSTGCTDARPAPSVSEEP